MWLIDNFGEFLFLLLAFSVWMCKLGVSLYSYSDVLCKLYNGEGCLGPATFSVRDDDTTIMLQLPDSPAAGLVCQSSKKGVDHWRGCQSRWDGMASNFWGMFEYFPNTLSHFFQTHFHTYPLSNFQVRRHPEQTSHGERLLAILDIPTTSANKQKLVMLIFQS